MAEVCGHKDDSIVAKVGQDEDGGAVAKSHGLNGSNDAAKVVRDKDDGVISKVGEDEDEDVIITGVQE